MRAQFGDLHAVLQRHFGHAAFRDAQHDLVRTVLDGRDLLAVMPTGSGKSLGFQLPAILLRGVTLVVSPLISLMKDQVDELTARGIAAAAVHSQTDREERQQIQRTVREGALRLLYVAPERFASEAFLSLLAEIAVARFVVDEAHCVSQWRHDFRPDYRRLKTAADRCRRGDGQAGRPPMAAFTATATPEVREDIVALLGLGDPRVIVAGFDRPNIRLYVQPVAGEADKHARLRRLVGDGRSLVYAATRKGAVAAAATLCAAGPAPQPPIMPGCRPPNARASRTPSPRATFASCARPTRSAWSMICPRHSRGCPRPACCATSRRGRSNAGSTQRAPRMDRGPVSAPELVHVPFDGHVLAPLVLPLPVLPDRRRPLAHPAEAEVVIRQPGGQRERRGDDQANTEPGIRSHHGTRTALTARACNGLSWCEAQPSSSSFS